MRLKLPTSKTMLTLFLDQSAPCEFLGLPVGNMKLVKCKYIIYDH